MALFRVFAAVTWCIGMAALVIGWWFEEPPGASGAFLIAVALAYVTLDLIGRAIDAVELAIIRRHRHLDRRPQI
jgi:hypothetical protein